MKINIRQWRSMSPEERVALLKEHIAKTLSDVV